MGKRMFAFIISLMSISLVGIIAVQIFWIENSIDIREKQFYNDVYFALVKTDEIIYRKDFVNFTAQFKDFYKTKKIAEKAYFTKFVYEQINTTTNEIFRFSSSGLYENNYYKGVKDFYKNDSILITSLKSKNDVFKVVKSTNTTELSKMKAVERFTFYNSLTELDKFTIEDAYQNNNKTIYERLSKEVLEDVLKKELSKLGIETYFKYGVFKDKQLTKIKSDNFKISEDSKSYKKPIFTKDINNKNYELHLVFPEKRRYVLSDIAVLLLLSVFFTIIIMIAFASSLYQLIKQKKISSIKTDFINNMTHEFKTPIATINLALDSMKDSRVINDNSKVLRYISMIKEENNRMHSQVENVLRISKLNKKQFEIPMTVLDFYEVLKNAMSHLDLLLKSKKGTIKLNRKQTKSEGLGNKFHLTNVFMNILENAVKYSIDSPRIDIFIENSVKYLTIKIKDKGLGMSKYNQKHAFDEFYRGQKGNIHDTKGHGLGLSYSKKVVEQHQGTIIVESEKGKGSTFTVKLPLV